MLLCVFLAVFQVDFAVIWRKCPDFPGHIAHVVLYKYIVYKYTASHGDASIGEVEGARRNRSGLRLTISMRGRTGLL